MYLYNCVNDNKEEKEAQGAPNTEIILTHVHRREAARVTEKASPFPHL